MKLKNVNIFERHIEKAILAVGILFGLIVVWQCVLSDPYAVEVANQRVRPREVETKVLQAATKLERRLNSPTSSLPDIAIPDYFQMFDRHLQFNPTAVALSTPLSQWGITLDVPRVTQALEKDPPIPPAPVEITARAGFGVLVDPSLITQRFGENVSQQFTTIVDPRHPRDFFCVAVQSQYHMGAWRAKLRDESTIRVQWWRDKLLLTDVVVQRQAYNAEQGMWQPPEDLTPLPHALGIREAPTAWTKTHAQEVLQHVKTNQAQIAGTELVPLTTDSGLTWLEPDGTTPATSGEPLTTAPSSTEAELERPPTETITLLAYDLTAKPGMTYRYRMRTSVMNPLFHREALEDDLRDRHFNRLALASEFSPWSSPVSIVAPYQFFVVDGSLQKRQVKVEVWRIFHGAYRVHEFSVMPGDQIGGVVPITIGDQTYDMDMNAGCLMVDLEAGRDGHADLGASSSSRTKAQRVFYLDLSTNQLHYRAIDDDQTSPERKSLHGQLAEKPKQ